MVDPFPVEPFEYAKKGNKDDLKWDISPMMMLKFRQRVELNPSFSKVFNIKYNLTKAMKREFHHRTKGERNIITELTGYTGSGKSICAVTIALKWMKKKIVADDILFSTEEILRRSQEIGQNHTLIRDEQTRGSGMGSRREEEEQENLEDTTRKFGLNIIYCSPTTRDHTTAHYNLEIICINKAKRLTKVAIIGFNGQYLGYFVIKVIEEDHKLWIAYEKNKDEFIKSVLGRSMQRLSIDDRSKELKKHPQYKFAKTMEQKKIIAMKLYPTLTTQEISSIVGNIGLMDAYSHRNKK